MEHEINHSAPAVNALLPREMAEKAEQIGVDKSRLDFVCLAVLAVLAGAFIAFGAVAAAVAGAGMAGVWPYGVKQLLSGLVFSTGLILVVVGGAELFTGNNLMVIAWASRRIKLHELLRAWGVVYLGNFAGAGATALFVFLAEFHLKGEGAVGAVILEAAAAKAGLPFLKALMLGILGNVLVCLAVWLTYSARTTTDRILAIVPPVTVFVAAGFEHSVANMFILPLGLMIKAWAPGAFWAASGLSPSSFDTLTLAGFIDNLVPVTIGNVIGGGVMVGAVYWFIYLRKRHSRTGGDR